MNAYEPCLPHLPDPQQAPEVFYYCPVCGKEIYEDVYTDAESGLVVGCDQCIKRASKEDVLDGE